MPEYVFVRGARQLLTLRGPDAPRRGSASRDIGIIEDGSVLLRDDRIFALGSTRRIENMKEARNALEIPATGCVVMPGFTDVNMNMSEPFDPGVSERSRTRRLQRTFEASLSLMRSCLQHGTVAAQVSAQAMAPTYEADLPLLRQLSKVGRMPVEAQRFWQISRFPENVTEESELLQTFDTLTRRKLISGIELSADFLSASDARSRVAGHLLAACARSRLGVILKWRPDTGRSLRSELAYWKPTAIHCSASLSQAEIDVCSDWSNVTIFSPGCELGHAGATGLRRLVDNGGAVALGSGYDVVRSPGFSMQMAITLGVLNAQLSPEEAITAATINAACAAGVGDVIGSLQTGKRADLLVLTIPDYREISRQFGINQVGMVFREGALVFNRSRWKIGAHAAVAGRMRS